MEESTERLDTAEIRSRLITERDRVQSIIQRLEAEQIALGTLERAEGGGFGDLGDVGTELSIREIDLGLMQSLQKRLADVEAALERLDAGTYGICTICGGKIDPERLLALPWTDRCIECQRREERAAG